MMNIGQFNVIHHEIEGSTIFRHLHHMIPSKSVEKWHTHSESAIQNPSTIHCSIDTLGLAMVVLCCVMMCSVLLVIDLID